jgi:hypothetical protein
MEYSSMEYSSSSIEYLNRGGAGYGIFKYGILKFKY